MAYIAIGILSLGLTVYLRRKVASRLLLTVLAAAGASVTFQLLAYMSRGYLDPYFLIAFAMSFLFALLTSAVALLALGRFPNGGGMRGR